MLLVHCTCHTPCDRMNAGAGIHSGSQALNKAAKVPPVNAQAALGPASFQAPKEETLRKQKLPNCAECYGCNNELRSMGNCSKPLFFNRRCGEASIW